MSGLRIVCAANRLGSIIILGLRHWDGIMRESIENADKCWTLPQDTQWEQGFIDNLGCFLTREDAWIVAVDAGQIIKRVGGDFNVDTGVGKLYSENLY